MSLTQPLFTRCPRLLTAAHNRPPMQLGERGDAVVRLQVALLSVGADLPRSTQNQTAMPDGIFGVETSAAVRDFQRTNRLVVDGIVGRQTLATLDKLLPPPIDKYPCCGNGVGGNRGCVPVLRQKLVGAGFHTLGATSSSIGMTAPSGLRFLTTAQEATATGVFGSSLDFTRILLSDALGAGGRPFTVAVPILSTPAGGVSLTFVVINAGTFAPATNLLIHELTHAWQSQHSSTPTQFMVKSVQSQAIAGSLNLLGADASAYYFRPGRSFARYGAEQIACQVEKGVSAIVSSVKSLPPFVPHPKMRLAFRCPIGR